MKTANKPSKILTMKAQAYNIIKGGILSGEYKPGCWLQEKELAKSLEVSRSPVREALKELAGEGLVVNIPNKGVFVKKLTVKEVNDIFELRSLVESYALERATSFHTEEDLQALEQIMRDLEAAFAEHDVDRYAQTDTRLHHRILKMSGNQMMYKAVTNIFSLLQPFTTLSLIQEKRFNESLYEHRGIVAGIRDRDYETAWHWNSTHLNKAKEDVIIRVKILAGEDL